MNDEWLEAWAAMETAQDGLRAASEALSRRWQDVTDMRNDLIDLRIAETPREVWLQDEEQLKWLLRMGRTHHGAYTLMRELQAVNRRDLLLAGIDGRPGYEDQGLPVLTLMLIKDQDVAELEQVIRGWTARWLLGRPDMPMRILVDRDGMGAWTASWAPDADQAVVQQLCYGNTVQHYAGNLRGALEYVAAHVWYERPDAEGY